MRFNTVEEVFREYASNLIVNEQLYVILKHFRLGWAQKSDDYIEFLGNNLTGVYPIRFSVQDEETLFEFLQVDRDQLQKMIYNINGIQPNMRTISNATYVTLMYIAHRFNNSNLKREMKEDAIRECYYIFAYKVICSLTAHYFSRYTVDITIAKAVNERMTNKFLIKKFNSWQKLFEYKSEDLLPNGIHAKRIQTFHVLDMIRIISDLQTKLRDIFKSNYAVLMKVKENNEKVTSTTLIGLDEEGNETIKDITNRTDTYITYLKSIITSKYDFINKDIVAFIGSIVKDTTEEYILKILEHLTIMDTKKTDEILNEILLSAISFLTKKKLNKDFIQNIYEITTTLCSYWKSSNIINSQIIKIKKELYKITSIVLKTKNNSRIINTYVAVMVYLVIRAFYVKK